MTHSYLGYPGPNPGKVYPNFCACSIPTHISPLNAGYGGTAGLNYRYITPWERPGGLFVPARPFTHISMDATGNQQTWNCWDFHTFSDWDPGTPGSCASYVGTTPLLFRHVAQMGPPDTANSRIRARKVENDHDSNGFGSNRGNLVLFLTLSYDFARGITPRAQRLSTDHHVVCSGCQGFMGVRPMTSERQPGPYLGPKPYLHRTSARWG